MRTKTNSRAAAARLWTIQGVLAVLFLFAGSIKWMMPIQVLEAQSHLPGAFVRFIGVCEILGALGLVLPGLLRTRVDLTPLAATGLVLVMTGATTITIESGQILPALLPFALGLLTSFVVFGRWPSAPVVQEERRPVLNRAT
ncbi:MAG: DoxX family protein [Gemmatimonadaceae bacterium]